MVINKQCCHLLDDEKSKAIRQMAILVNGRSIRISERYERKTIAMTARTNKDRSMYVWQIQHEQSSLVLMKVAWTVRNQTYGQSLGQHSPEEVTAIGQANE